MQLNKEHCFQFTDGTLLPVGTIYCIGRNYAAHAREMGAEVPAQPLIFIKPPAAYCAPDNAIIHRPSYSQELHHEAEIVIVIGREYQPGDDPAVCIAGYGIGLDLTLRDIQAEAKKKGEPWARSKSFAGSAPVSEIIPATQFNGIPEFTFSLSVNGIIRQQGDTRLMERPFSALIKAVGDIFTLRPGDCIFTGTPEGVSALHDGDTVHAVLDKHTNLNCTVHIP
jgi:2-keto-4-pentenoate hydratase/2-oxohepta-3-ene-1,7-dioic acid hydratase in catechol pathway